MKRNIWDAETDQARNERFLHLFAEIEKALKKRLRLPAQSHSSVSELARRYLSRNPYWAECAENLSLLREIRNLLTHNRNASDGYPISVTARSIEQLETIKRGFDAPEPVGRDYEKTVQTVAADDTLAFVVATAVQNGYSQFPVIQNDRFLGMITENEITRWLGKRAISGSCQIDLGEAMVKTVLKEKDPNREAPIFRFVATTEPVEEVMGLFSASPLLETVLLLNDMNRKDLIAGIITQWDAARYRVH